MNRILVVMTLSVLFQGVAQSAERSHSAEVRQVVLTDRGSRLDVSRPDLDFRVEVVGDQEGLKSERFRNGRPWIVAQPGETYAIRLYNPLPVRVAVNLTVDGLNTLTGQPSGIKDGEKWMIEANSFIELRGWQVNGAQSRRFFFTNKPRSYAKWREDETGKPLAANVGVIGAAYFWSQEELNEYYAARPIDQRTPVPCCAIENSPASPDIEGLSFQGARAASMLSAQRPLAEDKKDIAATGMGDRESHPTTEVEFTYDRGMYHSKDAVMIFYDFESQPTPNPFPNIEYAPEMPLER